MEVRWGCDSVTREDADRVHNFLTCRGDKSGFSPEVTIFENAVRELTDSTYCIACSNGTAALIVAVLALERVYGFKKPIISVPNWTYMAPVNVANQFGQLRLVDINHTTLNMDLELVPKETNIIMSVDMAGFPSDYDKLKSMNRPVISDAAESFGAKYKGKHVVRLSDVSITSFHSSKIITTGEGGMIFTNSANINYACRQIINQGYAPNGAKTHLHTDVGFNFRMSGMQAVLGYSQLLRLNELLERRRQKVELYKQLLDGDGIFQQEIEGAEPSYFSFVIKLWSADQRDFIASYLAENGIETRIWVPANMQVPYKKCNDTQIFPASYFVAQTHLRLPLHNQITDNDIYYVTKNFIKANSLYHASLKQK
jgi:dTDP-4-amino-4,6-dideoxygalactose transaminase